MTDEDINRVASAITDGIDADIPTYDIARRAIAAMAACPFWNGEKSLSSADERLADSKIRVMTIAEMAEDAFLKAEHVKALQMMNTPTDFEERKNAFVALAVAREAANKAQAALDSILAKAR